MKGLHAMVKYTDYRKAVDCVYIHNVVLSAIPSATATVRALARLSRISRTVFSVLIKYNYI